MSQGKITSWDQALMIAAALADGLLTGGNVDRMLVATPAWARVGFAGWADFTRAADLGNGVIFYPAMALGGTGAVVLAAVIFAMRGRSPRQASAPVFLAALLMVAALPFSLLATPYIQSLRHIPNANTAKLAVAFAGAHFWGKGQALLHLAAFCAELWAIVALAKPQTVQQAGQQA